MVKVSNEQLNKLKEKWSHPLIVDEEDDEVTSTKEVTSTTPHPRLLAAKRRKIVPLSLAVVTPGETKEDFKENDNEAATAHASVQFDRNAKMEAVTPSKELTGVEESITEICASISNHVYSAKSKNDFRLEAREFLSSPSVAVPLVLAAIVLYFTIPRKAKNKDAPPMVKPINNIPLVGRIVEFGKGPLKMVQRCYEEYGPVYTVPMGNQRLTFLIGPEAQEAFCKANDEVLSQDEVYQFMKPVFGPGVVYDATKKKRQVQFTSMANGLRTSRLKAYVEKIEKETRDYLADWGNEGEVDLFQALSELTILTASRCLHGNDVRENLFREVSELYHDLDHGLTPLTVFFPNAPTEAHKKRNIARNKMVELFSKVIKERRENPSASQSDGTDILSIFMKMKYKDGTAATDEHVTGLLIALLFAGQHTSCITSTWTILFILFNKQIKNRIMAEQRDIFGDELSGNVDFDKLNNMQLLHDSMKEALRLNPPLILLIRKAMKDLPVTAQGRKYTVPKGDTVLISPTVGMRVPEAFENPDVFDPDRFGPGREEHKKSPYAYLGFGGGMHSCMGQNFAFVQVKTILSVLFREYHIDMVADELPEIDFTQMVVGPKGDCRVTYKKR